MSLETLVDVANALDVSADYILADCINTHENVCENEFAEQIKECTHHWSNGTVKTVTDLTGTDIFTDDYRDIINKLCAKKCSNVTATIVTAE